MHSDDESLIVDLTNPEDARAKLPRARQILDRKEARLRERTADVESFRRVVETLGLIAGVAGPPLDDPNDGGAETPPEGSTPANGSVSPQPLDLVVSVIDRVQRPIRSRDVADMLRHDGHVIANDVVSNALYYAAERAKPPRIRKLRERGVYGPLPEPVTEPAREFRHVSAFARPERLPDERDADS
jgi:hypothetical protein